MAIPILADDARPDSAIILLMDSTAATIHMHTSEQADIPHLEMFMPIGSLGF